MTISTLRGVIHKYRHYEDLEPSTWNCWSNNNWGFYSFDKRPFTTDKDLIRSYYSKIKNLLTNKIINTFLDLCLFYGYLSFKHAELKDKNFLLGVPIKENFYSLRLFKDSISPYHLGICSSDNYNVPYLCTEPTGNYNIVKNIDISAAVNTGIPLEEYPLMINHPFLSKFIEIKLK